MPSSRWRSGRACRHEPAAEAALGGQAPGRAGRRQPLVGAACAALRALPSASRCRSPPLPPPAVVRRAASLLRRRHRHRAQPETAGAREGRRPGAADRRAPERNGRRRATRCSISRAADEARACASGRRGTRPRLSPASRHQRGADRVLFGAGGDCSRRTRSCLARRGDRHGARRLSRLVGKGDAAAGRVNLGEIMVWLRENLPADAIITNGAGNFAGWIHRFYRFRKFATHLAPTSGSMGYGIAGRGGDAAALSRAHAWCASTATATS